MHTLVGAGSAGKGGGGGLDIANLVKPALARGEFQVIGATTIDEFRKYIERDAALERRFQPVMVNEPTPAETLQILKGLKDKYERHHKVSRRGVKGGRRRARVGSAVVRQQTGLHYVAAMPDL